MIAFDGVTKRYPDGTVAVDDLSLAAPTGRSPCWSGPSGCGKTTSLRMVNRMIEPTSGAITLDGRDTARMKDSELRRGMGYVIQHAGLFPHRTVLDNVGTVPRLLGWDRKTDRPAGPRSCSSGSGCRPSFASRYPAQLSGGQQQRVGVARALAADPPVMLMDEPFSAVDPVVREQLQDEFLRLQGELGKTILFVTHDIDEAIKLGDQVAVLRVGGTLAQLADAGIPARPPGGRLRRRLRRPRPRLPRAVASSPPRACRCRPERTLHARRDHGRGLDAGLGARRRRREPAARAGSSRAGSTASSAPRCCTAAAPSHAASGPLRAALDAALSSPSRRGVIVDDSGALVGTVRAHEVLTAIEEAQRPEAEDPVQPGGAGAMTWFLDHTDDVLRLAAQHIYLAGLPLVLGPAHRAAARLAGPALPRRSTLPFTAGFGLLYTIPSLALFILLPAILGTARSSTRVNVVVAMTIYTVALLVRTVADGLGAVPDDVNQAATAMGYGRGKRVLRRRAARWPCPSSPRECGWRR